MAVLGLHYPRPPCFGDGSGDVEAVWIRGCVHVRGVNGIGTTDVEDVPVVRRGGRRTAERRARKQTEEAKRRRCLWYEGVPLALGGRSAAGPPRVVRQRLLRNGDRIWVKRWGLESDQERVWGGYLSLFLGTCGPQCG